MSLLLDARRKQQQVQDGYDKYAEVDLSLEKQQNPATAVLDIHKIRNIRSAGKNLFSDKSPESSASHTGIRRNFLLILCCVILLLGYGAGYYLYGGSVSNAQSQHQDTSVPILESISSADAAESKAGNIFAAETAPANSAGSTLKPLLITIAPPVKNRVLTKPALPENSQIRIERQKAGLVDSLLDNAYLAYRNGNTDAAQLLYREMLGRDAHNINALLGLAVIAQQRGEDMLATQYYSRALALEPRNAVANAGMSALTAEDSNENSLKNLLNEQQDSAVLHFALGNRYAEKLRWEEAQQSYFNAYTLEPDNAEFVFNLGVSLDHLGQSKLAAQFYQRALQLEQVGGDQELNPRFNHAQTEQRIRELIR
jgi:Flp pilus assembly protein TadD